MNYIKLTVEELLEVAQDKWTLPGVRKLAAKLAYIKLVSAGADLDQLDRAERLFGPMEAYYNEDTVD